MKARTRIAELVAQNQQRLEALDRLNQRILDRIEKTKKALES